LQTAEVSFKPHCK